MKGRLIGALWIIAALALAYFAFDGQYFFVLVWFALAMAYAEIYVVTDANPWRMTPYDGKFKNIHMFQSCILVFAAVEAWFVNLDEIVMIILVCVLSDVGAFTVGKLIGKHKVTFLRQISPNKTYEGYIGGIIAPLFALLLGPALFGVEPTLPLLIWVIMGGLAAEIGDLLGSATKRCLGMKDSNEELIKYGVFRILEHPVKGHGGYLDRVDSLAFGLSAYAIIKLVASLL